MTTLRVIIAVMLLAFGLGTILANWIVTIQWIRARKRSSMILIAGGVMAFTAIALWPGADWRLGLLFVALDPGCFRFLLPLHWLSRDSQKPADG